MFVFIREGEKIERGRWKRNAVAMRMAHHAEDDPFKKLLED